MKAKTEELLYFLLWTCDILFHPTFRNITDSFESWAYRNGLLPQIHRLEQQQWLERKVGGKGDRLLRLTEAGRLRALGGRDPETCWRRPWDGYWYQALFDVPEKQKNKRDQLRRVLHLRGFGYLQRSVWVTPGPVEQVRALLATGPVNVKNLILMAARPCAGESDADIVAGAWDFCQINRTYAKHREILARRPCWSIRTQTEARAFQRWLYRERVAWAEAMARDPLLPEVLLPSGYMGRKAWDHRKAVMAKAADQVRAFKPS